MEMHSSAWRSKAEWVKGVRGQLTDMEPPRERKYKCCIKNGSYIYVCSFHKWARDQREVKHTKYGKHGIFMSHVRQKVHFCTFVTCVLLVSTDCKRVTEPAGTQRHLSVLLHLFKNWWYFTAADWWRSQFLTQFMQIVAQPLQMTVK